MPIALDPNDTIVAIASPPGLGLRGILRLSGPSAISLVLADFVPDRRPSPPSSPPRRARAVSGDLRIAGLRPLLPATLAVWYAPRTYTGQDVVEIHLVGAPPLLRVLLAHYISKGARHAEPGEFTLRAFLSGRIDLTRAEAVVGVIDAGTPAQLDAALEQLAGGVSGPILTMRDHLLDVVAHLEADLDFTDEHDVDPIGRLALATELAEARRTLAQLARRLSDRESREGQPRAVFIGPPNVGKSRLFNALVGRDEAIVSPQAGTTRDYLSALCECDGVTVEVVDTAGIEPASDSIASQAQALRDVQSERADVVLWCRSSERAGPCDRTAVPHHAVIHVWTKCDQAYPRLAPGHAEFEIITSAVAGTGLDALRSAIARVISSSRADNALAAGTGARCSGNLRLAQDALGRAAAILAAGGGDELVALDLREAIDELGKIVGAVVTDDILDRIFRRFCIGK